MIKLYGHFKPYLDPMDNVLAETCQVRDRMTRYQSTTLTITDIPCGLSLALCMAS
jgi:hypothetical protein